jgi:hypothetical protein
MAPLHSNSAVLQGGTGTVTRTTWGVSGSSDNYCEWLQGTAVDNSGASLVPNEPVGCVDGGGGATCSSYGAKQHIILVMYPEDTAAGMVGSNNIDGLTSDFDFTLRGTYRFKSASNPSSWSQFISVCGDPANPLVNGSQPYSIAGQENMLDYYVPFKRLFGNFPANATALNTNIENTYQDSLTGQLLQYFNVGDMFDATEAMKFADNLWSQISETDPRWNNLSAADKRKCVYISAEPIQTGEHYIPNHYLAAHITASNVKQNMFSQHDLGWYAGIYNDVHEQIYNEFFIGGSANSTNDVGMWSDSTGNSGWDLIIHSNKDGHVQFVGNTFWEVTGGTAYWYYNTSNTGTSALRADHLSPIGSALGNSIAGGLLEGATSSDRLRSGLTPLCASGYVGAAPTGGYKPTHGVLSLSKEGDENNGAFNTNGAYSLYNLSGGPGANFPNGQGYGSGSPNWANAAYPNMIFGIEDQVLQIGATTTNATRHPVLAGSFDLFGTLNQSAFNTSNADKIEATSLGNYSGDNYFLEPTIVRIDRIDYTPWTSNTSSGEQRNYNMSSLYYNSFSGCNQGPLSLTFAVTDGPGCGSGCSGEVQINTDLTTLNIENCEIHWGLTGQTSTPIFSAGPNSNHTGSGSWMDSGGTQHIVAAPCAKIQNVCPGSHNVMIIDQTTGCAHLEFFTISSLGAPPVISNVALTQPQCSTNGWITLIAITLVVLEELHLTLGLLLMVQVL